MLKNQLLSHSLLETWANYENQVHLSRNNTSVKNIHQLRISTQKLEAILTLANGLKANHNSKNIIFLIKKVRKSLGPLRDIQVESKVFNELSGKKLESSKHDQFSKFFLDQKKAAKKKATKCLDEISLKKERLRIQKLANRLVSVEAKKTEKQIQNELNRNIKSSIIKLNHFVAHIDPKRVKDIHRFRIQAKKLRYQGEILNSLTAKPMFDLKNLKSAQSIAGRIQNDSVLLKTLDRFLSKKKHAEDPNALSVQKKIAVHQRKLINNNFKELSAIRWGSWN